MAVPGGHHTTSRSRHACAAPACLHWGLKRGDDYLNPLSLLLGEVRLLSDADAAAIAGQARG